jgi:hypothetical protein
LLRHEERSGIAAAATSAVEVLALPPRPAGAGTSFIRLLLNRNGRIIDDNFYWSNGPGGSCRDLETLPKVALAADATQVIGDGTTQINVNLANPSSTVALMARLKVERRASGTRVLPVFYEDNYVSLLPGEKRCVEMTFATADLAGEAPLLSVEGWNILPAAVKLR